MKCHTGLGLSPWGWPFKTGTVPRCSRSGHIPRHRWSHVQLPRATAVLSGRAEVLSRSHLWSSGSLGSTVE